jgi:hypothetical protein
VSRIVSFVFWFCTLELLWAMLVGTTQSTELLVGLAAAALGAAFAEVLRTQGLFVIAPDWRLLAKAWKLPWLVPFDFGLVTWTLVRSLARGGRVRGRWVTVPYPLARGAKGSWQRTFAVATANGAANALVVDVGERESELHALEPGVFSGRTVL